MSEGPHIVYSREREEYILDMLEIELDEEDYLVDGESGERIVSAGGDELTIDEVGYFKRGDDGEVIPVKDDVSSILREVKEE